MPENLEEKSKIEDPKFVGEFRDTYAEEVEKYREKGYSQINDDPEKIIGGGLIRERDPQWAVFVRVSQDFGLSHDEMEELKKKFFVSET